MASASYDRPFSLSFRLVFCAGALVSAVAFVRGAYLIGALVGAAASAVSILLYFASRKALVEAGIGRAAHPGWGFALTMPAIAGFLLVLAWYEVTDTRRRASMTGPSNDR